VSCAGWGDLSASFGSGGSVDCRSDWAMGLTGGFGLPRGFCSDAFSSGFFFESIFGVDGCLDSLDTCAIGVAFGFGVSAKGAESVEAGVGGAVAIGAPSGLAICGAALRAAGFGVSARGGAESVEAGAGGAVASGAPSGLTICWAADRAAGFGVSASGGAEAVEAGVDGAVVIGSPSSLITCEGTRTAAELGGTGVDAGAADSKPEEARCGASTSPFPQAGTEPLFAGAVMASGRVSRLPACKGAACWLSFISEWESVPSVVATEGSSVGTSGVLLTRATLA
jgi:hypothetical protein